MRNGKRGRYTLEFKQEAVRLVESGQSVASASRSLGVVEQTLSHWVKAHRAGTLKAVAGNGSVTAEQMEIKSFTSRAGAGDDGARHPGKSDGGSGANRIWCRIGWSFGDRGLTMGRLRSIEELFASRHFDREVIILRNGRSMPLAIPRSPTTSPADRFRSPVRTASGPYFDVSVTTGAANVGLILHNGNTKDPGPNQFVDPATQGNEFCQSASSCSNKLGGNSSRA
jgi:transposase